MAKQIKLPSGATVMLKDATDLRVKDRKNVMKIADSAPGGDLAKALALSDGLVAMLVISWSFDLPVPSEKLDSVDELSMADYDALVEATKEAQKALFPSLGDTPENEADPKAITENSKG